MENVFLPQILNLSSLSDSDYYETLIADPKTILLEHFEAQVADLIKCQNPSITFTDELLSKKVLQWIDNKNPKFLGVWVYYPWNFHLIHILNEADFISVRTNRNQLKITNEEQQVLSNKTIGVVGLSVGNAIAFTMAQERICGRLKLADFDTLELSNLNRIHASLIDLGTPKVILAARQIAEIDPFLKIEIFSEGLTPNNIDDFFNKENPLDLVVEVCDNLQSKIDIRFKSKKDRIPVLMDTNDRGMIDVERYDLDPELPIFHGAINAFLDKDNKVKVTPDNRNLLLASIVDFNALSDGMKLSIGHIGKTISNWPQLASSVVLGASITTDLARKILLKSHTSSGRYYVDLNAIFEN